MIGGGWAGAALALAVSPLLTSWMVALSGGVVTGWWRPSRVPLAWWAVVAAVVGSLAVLAAPGRPGAAWWVFAAGGAVLLLVDVRTCRLPARLTYPLAAVVAGCLIASGDPAALLRAGLAAVVVGLCYFAVRFAHPPAIGLGDVRVAALTAGLLGWTGWAAVLHGQLLAVLFAGVTGLIVQLRRGRVSTLVEVPLGPALIVAAVLALWF